MDLYGPPLAIFSTPAQSYPRFAKLLIAFQTITQIRQLTGTVNMLGCCYGSVVVNRVDGFDMESGRWLSKAEFRLQELLCGAYGQTTGRDGHGRN